MFHFSGFPLPRSPWFVTALNRRPGFPIRTSPDQRLLATSPKLFAGCYVLHRLSMSRHPPYALECSLTTKARKRSCRPTDHGTSGIIVPYIGMETYISLAFRIGCQSSRGGVPPRKRKTEQFHRRSVVGDSPDCRFPLAGPTTGSISFQKDRSDSGRNVHP